MKKRIYILLINIIILLLLPTRVLAIDEIIDENINQSEEQVEVIPDNNETIIEEEKEEDNKEEIITDDSLVIEKNTVQEEISEKNKELTTNSEPILTKSTDETDVPTNGLPLVIIRVDEREDTLSNLNDNSDESSPQYGTIEDINNSLDHSVRGVGTVEIKLPDNYESEYGSNIIPEGEQPLEYIRGRGNSTWYLDKKPYKLKYEKKQEILGMGKNKEWALLANHIDKTLTNNAIAMWISQEFGMEYTNQMVPVEVIMIGSSSGKKYLGSYYLSELVDIGEGRIDIPELKKEKKEGDEISGGYLISIYYDSQDSNKPRSTVFEVDSGLQFINENPKYESEDLTEWQQEQRNYIRDYINKIDNIIVNSETIDEKTHNELDSLMDLKSTADYYLIQEFLISFDAYKTSSNYLYKKPNDKLYWGPIWDFDLMFFWVDKDNPETATGFNNYYDNIWIDSLRDKDPLFVDLLKERWKVLEPVLTKVTETGGIIDQYKERQRAAWNANYELWHESITSSDFDLDEELEKTRNLIDFRIKWFNENIDLIGKALCTVNYEVDGVIVKSLKERYDHSYEDIDLEPTKEGYFFDGWVDKDTNEKITYEKVLKDTTLIPIFVDPNEIDEEIIFFLNKDEAWVYLDEEIYELNEPRIYPKDYYDLLRGNFTWTSSNENVGTVDKMGYVTLHSLGDTTITATMFNGLTKSYILHVIDENTETIEEPEEIIFEQDSYTIEVGEYVQIIHRFLPDIPINPNNYISVECEAEDEEIVQLDYPDFYVMKGLKEGKTKITFTVYSGYSDDYIIEKTIEVTVVAKKEDQVEDPEEDNKEETNTNNETNIIIDDSKNNNEPLSINNNQPIIINNIKKSSKKHLQPTYLLEELEEYEEDKDEETKITDNEEEKHEKEETTEDNNEEKNNKKYFIISLLIVSIIIIILSFIIFNEKE